MKISKTRLEEAARADGSDVAANLPPIDFLPAEVEHLARAAAIAFGLEVEE